MKRFDRASLELLHAQLLIPEEYTLENGSRVPGEQHILTLRSLFARIDLLSSSFGSLIGMPAQCMKCVVLMLK